MITIIAAITPPAIAPVAVDSGMSGSVSPGANVGGGRVSVSSK